MKIFLNLKSLPLVLLLLIFRLFLKIKRESHAYFIFMYRYDSVVTVVLYKNSLTTGENVNFGLDSYDSLFYKLRD